MRLQIVVADPSGNRTGFVLSPVDPKDRAAIAFRLMALPERKIEQVGFLHDGRMDMMGGEFCGNASRSFGAWKRMSRETGFARGFLGRDLEQVSVSGSAKPLTVTLEGLGDEPACLATIEMPLPRRIEPFLLETLGAGRLVEYEGISHLILPGKQPEEGDFSAAEAFLQEKKACRECFGLIYLEKEDRMRPLVFVRETETLIWESSCASGSCAVAAALAAQKKKSCKLRLSQPGGVLECEARWQGGEITALSLGGIVRFSPVEEIILPEAGQMR